MSTALATPNTRLVTSGLNPMCTAHSGSTTCRAARTAPIASTATPSVSSIRR
jgi:hypothetical protein